MRMVDAGVLGTADRVELIDGVLHDMSPLSPTHSEIVARLGLHFTGASPEHEARVQDLLVVEGGFVMPDLMVIKPPPPGRHPNTAVLVVEVAVSSQRHDAWKAGPYARAGVGEYWIVDTPGRVVRVHRKAGRRGYGEIVDFGDGAEIAPALPAPAFAVSALLGPPAA